MQNGFVENSVTNGRKNVSTFISPVPTPWHTPQSIKSQFYTYCSLESFQIWCRVEGEGQFAHKYKFVPDVYLCGSLDWRSRIGLEFCLQKLPRNHRLLLITFIHAVPRHSDGEVRGFLWRRQVLALSSSIRYRRMGHEGVGEKPEKGKAERTSWENKIPWMKTWREEQEPNPGSFLSWMGEGAVAPILALYFCFCFLEINSNPLEDDDASLAALSM